MYMWEILYIAHKDSTVPIYYIKGPGSPIVKEPFKMWYSDKKRAMESDRCRLDRGGT